MPASICSVVAIKVENQRLAVLFRFFRVGVSRLHDMSTDRQHAFMAFIAKEVNMRLIYLFIFLVAMIVALRIRVHFLLR